MNKKNGIKVGFIAAAIALLVVAVAVPAGAGDLNKKHDLNRLLTGDYYQNGSFTCASSTFGFDPETLSRMPYVVDGRIVMPIDGYNVSGSTQGVTTFNHREGTYHFEGEVLSVSYEKAGSTTPAKYPVTQYSMTCDGYYEVNEHLQGRGYDGTCTLLVKAGPYASIASMDGYRIELSNLQSKSQLIGTMGNILSLKTDTEPNVEIIKIYNSPDFPSPSFPSPFTMQRICASSGTSMKLVGPAKNYEMTSQGE